MVLSKKHLKIIEEWINNGGDEVEISMKYGISYKQWVKWLSDKSFSDEINGRIEMAKRRSQLLMAKYLPLATAKLIELCNSDNNEISRKACLNIVELEADLKRVNNNSTQLEPDEPEGHIEPETASKILAILADSRKTKNRG